MRLVNHFILIGLLLTFLTSCTSPSGTTLIFNAGADASGADKELVELFNKEHPDIKIKLESAAKRSEADIFAADIIRTAEFAKAGWAEPLDKYVEKDQFYLTEFLPGPIQSCKYEDKLYALPWYTDAGILYYRKDMLEEFGYRPPQTWRELQEIARYLSATMEGFVFQAKQYEGLVCNALEYIWGNGGRVLSKDGKRVLLDSPQVIEALQFMKDLIYRYKVAPEGVLTYAEEDSRQVFQNGGAIFHRNWPYVWNHIVESEMWDKVGMVAMPKGPRGRSGASCLGGWNLMINAHSKHKAAAWKFIRWITSYKAQVIKSVKGGRIPTRRAVYKDKEVLAYAPHYTELYPIFLSARPRPLSPLYPEISDILQIEFHKALSDTKPVKDAVKDAAEQIRKLISR